MHSTLAPKETGPNDKAATKPDVVPTVRADKTSARPARDVRPSATQDRTKSDVSAGKSISVSNSTLAGNPGSAGKSTSAGKTTSAGNSTLAGNSGSAGKSAPVDKSAPSVDAAFRAATVDNNKVPSGRAAMGKWARRALMGFVFALCSGGAVAGWMQYGDAVKAMVASWAPNGGPASSPPQESSAVAEPPSAPVLQADAADQAAVPPAQSAPSVAPSATALPPETAQLLQSMSQQIEQIQASIEQLKAGQDQISRVIARNSETRPAQARTFEPNRTSEQNLGPRIPARPQNTAAAAPMRKPRPAYVPGQAATRPEVEPVLRPPLPLR
jgi:hypothetical protein